MAQFRKKPVVIEAIQWDGNRIVGDLPEWLREALNHPDTPDKLNGAVMRIGNTVHIGTLEGVVVAQPGDWILRGIKGELYPCKPDIFEATYEAVE
jgi:hypothetical protein